MKYKLPLLIVLLSISIVSSVFAQTGTLTGTVTESSSGDELPGVNIFIQDAERGTVTGADGTYSISSIPVGEYNVTFSFIGYISQNITVQIASGENQLDVSLEADLIGLEELVVTALGVERRERSLGYAAQEVEGSVLASSQEANVVNALAGRTAGVQINSSSGQPGASSRIIIRGNASMLGNNQPLFVVDGVPISNDSDGNVEGSTLFTGGTSNRGLDLNPNNIESMSVLKGASATALYGSRAANGAIIITTKSGTKGQAATVDFNTSVGWADTYTDGFQTDYLGGVDGYYYNGLPLDRGGYVQPGAPSTNPQTTRSWGPHKDEVPQEVLNDLGVDRIETFDPRDDFYQTGLTFNNSLSLSGGSENTTYFTSVSNTNQEGTVPGTELTRTNLMARFGASLSENLDVETSVNYVNTSNEWLAEGNGAQAYLFGLNFTPINFDLSQPSTYEDGTQRNFTTSFNNPFWLSENNGYTSDVDRFIANGRVSYNLLPWLNISERVGIDTYTDTRKGMRNIGTRGTPDGSMFDQVINRSEINSDLLVNANLDVTEDFTLDMLVGNNINVRDYNSKSVIGTGLNIPGYFHVSNANSTVPGESISERRLVSVFANATLDYQDIVYLTLTGRNDWSSTLPSDNNSYFYGSASLGFVFTDAIDVFEDTFFSYGKLRASISQIGNDAPVYSLATYFTQADPGDGVRGEIVYPYAGVNGYRLETAIGNPDLKPEISTEYEIGLDLRLFEGRARIDAAYYDRSTNDQIFNIPTSAGTGYTSRLANAGEIKNYGVELSVGVTPVQTSEFQWDVNVNFAKNTTEIVEFAPGVENIFLGGFTDPQIRIEDSKNGYGVIWSNRYQRNDNGELLIGDDGLPLVAADLGAIGNVMPDWTGNLRTSVSYKGINVSALLDKRQGGDILNMDQYYAVFYGTHISTADRGTSYVFDGVNANTGAPNDVEIVRDQAFYQGHYGSVFENFVEDGSFLKLREVSLSYTLPQSIIDQLPVRSLTVTGTGRNLWIDSDFSYKDPEGSLLGAGNAQGFYHMVTPASKSFVLSLNVSF
ncbi:SusC/RagA family TonB-linked outer membrane protein [Rhodohalobacter sp. 614A]|uniref:SusC/RagA family TonB-linked outer membrane protein n=1 Tax=Rhodohalobacter sp. 614A TaxID=2908649 RepID=UPI001F36398B|nr:SusC/RagA family TonB-linked outer membrane protein [Rhodohalobacter sp. 614A]